MDKRSFIKSITLTGVVAPFANSSLASWITKFNNKSPLALAQDEAYWEGIRSYYLLKPDYINLENGYYNILPKPILENYIQHIRDVNYQGAYYMRNVQFDDKKIMTEKVANMVGCNSDEFILTRNTTESLDMIISGYPWVTGDEAVMAEQDYGAMLEMFKQVSKRHGVVNKIISLPLNPSSDEEIVNLYANAITPKTKLLMICHMVNISGQILPVKKICDMAHKKGVEVMVDGAHAIAHIQFNLQDLNCDYYGASLHKWLSVPLGVGILYVNKKHITKIWPLLSEAQNIDSIKRLSHIGTTPVHTFLAIKDSIDFYHQIGAANKEARLRYLKQYWTSQVRNIGKIKVNTPVDSSRSCAIANVGVEGMKPALLAETLLKKYKIYTVAIDTANVQGCRITPNVFTSTNELDVFISALKDLS